MKLRSILGWGASVCAVGVAAVAMAAEPGPRTLSFEDRVRAQEAIERVYYSHQLGTTKPFEDAVPRSVLEAKVRKSLEETAALQTHWKTAVTDLMLDRELERMANGSRMPERLTELYAALGNDAFLIKETLARAALVDRLVHDFYDFDPALHVEANKAAEQIHRRLRSGDLKAIDEHPNRAVVVWTAEDATLRDPAHPALSPDEFLQRRAELPAVAGAVSGIKETRESYEMSVVLTDTGHEIRAAVYTVAKRDWDTWWASVRLDVPAETAVVSSLAAGAVSAHRTPRAPPRAPCTGDHWDNGVLANVPEPATGETAVWTGSLMLLWSRSFNRDQHSGWRYDPAIDTWTPITGSGSPAARAYHTAIWTGSEMVVWGGYASKGYPDFELFNTGGRYDPVSDSWRPTSTIGAPLARENHTAVWTGQLMLVWGGGNSALLNSGGRYDPVSDTWSPMSVSGAPAARSLHSAAWVAQRMVVWGGEIGFNFTNTGGRYDPITDSWASTSVIGAPSPGFVVPLVSTGHDVVVWGSGSVEPYICGGRYDPVADVWSPVTLDGAPSRRIGHSAVWTGSEMVVWGGSPVEGPLAANDGARYDPAADRWTPVSMTGAPQGRYSHAAVWTGTQMLVWGGSYDFFMSNNGGRYDPAADFWTPITASGGPSARSLNSAVWTGTEMIVWGGVSGSQKLRSGSRYDPMTDSWRQVSDAMAPSPRYAHTAVWSGGSMIVWGGITDAANDVTGGRYDPIADTWSPTSVAGAPARRLEHVAAWTGNRMIVWGGRSPDGLGDLNSGGRYDPETDTWSPTTQAGAPEPRFDLAAVWTGHELVVWGGFTLNGIARFLASGGRYDPVLDVWSPTSMGGAPHARYRHTAVWTGQSMIVWGGFNDDSSDLDTGGRYDPATDLWTSVSTANAPSRRSLHSAVWTGQAMVVWGGSFYGIADIRSGGRYDPHSDLWVATALDDAPLGRASHAAFWTGNEMLVWGGSVYDASGGRYYLGGWPNDDCDGDGFTATQGDCDDQVSSTFPGAPQLCNGANDDCMDPAWPALPLDERDADADGIRGCEGDCDDAHAAVYPGAPQICDGLNDDCSSHEWPAVPPGEADADHDHYRVCQGDCNDGDPAIHPGAPEVCNGADDDCNGVVDDAVSCDDGNPCTDDSCDGANGCRHVANEQPCDDRDDCTDGDTCSSGSCVGLPTTGNACSDSNACTVGDTCVGGLCVPGDPLHCDDGNICNGIELCDVNRGCFPETPLACDDQNACNGLETCDPVRGCLGGTPLHCDDGDVCNGHETCFPASGCRAGNPLHCDDGDPCDGQETCDPVAGCRSGTPLHCDDGLPCNGVEICFPYYGCYSPGPFTCDDGNSCTVDTCTASGCVHEPRTGSCYDGTPCTLGAVCIDGVCVGAVDCDDHNTCTDDRCDTWMGCVHDYNVAPCNDGNACTHNDHCTYGSCAGVQDPCDDGNVCTIDWCDPDRGCQHDTTQPCDDGNLCTLDSCDGVAGCVFTPLGSDVACDDFYDCTVGDHCDGQGGCRGTPDCDDGNPCTDDVPDESDVCTCTHIVTAEGTDCDDADACTTLDACDGAGHCLGVIPLMCDDGNSCTDDSCNPASGCVHVNNTAPCDDGNACTLGDVCGGGSCRAGAPIVCNDGNACTDDICNPATGCVFTDNTAPCDDGNACTLGDVCGGGSCHNGAPVVCAALDQCHDAGVCNPATGACSKPAKADGAACSDGSLCTTGDACVGGTCTPSFGGLNEPNPRSTGYYKRLCQGPHSGDQLTDADAVCVSTVAHTFAGISRVADLCAELLPSQPNSDPCDRADDDLMALALNICRARVCTLQRIDSQCGSNDRVGKSLTESDAILSSASRNADTCADAKCLDEEINTGRALEMNTLTLRREGSSVRLSWRVPYLDDGSGQPSKYHVWRRVAGSLAAFTKIGTTSSTTYLDGASATGAFEYEVTAVMT